MVYNLAIEKNIEDVRHHLKTAKNPLIFFDDDPDGLCSFLLFFHYMKKAHGIPLKTAPILNSSFLRKVEEYNPDKIFILDIPNIEQEFIDNIDVPIIWIDHHPVSKLKKKNLIYLNPRTYNNTYLPTSYICHQIVQQNMWLGVCGSISDYYLPEYLEEFKKKYKKLFPKKNIVGDIRYLSKIGEVMGLLSFILKGKTSDVNRNVNLLKNMDFEEIMGKNTPRSKYLWKRYGFNYKKYKKILEKAEKNLSTDDFLVYISASDEDSFLGDISNELAYKHPKKIVIVGRANKGFIRMSMRSPDIEIVTLLKKAMEGLKGSCGGHEKACGGSIDERDFGVFLERLRLYVEEAKKKF